MSVVVSAIITLIVVAITAASMVFFTKKAVDKFPSTNSYVNTQDISLRDESAVEFPKELQNTTGSLLVSGDIITKGTLKISSGQYVTVIKVQEPNSDQTYTLPSASGTVCLDINNCNYVTANQLQQVQNQLNGFVLPNIPAASLVNNQQGVVSIQGTVNQISVITSAGLLQLSTPQDIATGSSPAFASLLLTSNLNVNGIITTSLDCTGFANGGVLTTNGSGQVICDTDDSVGGGAISGSGNTNRLPIFTAAQIIADSWLLQNGSTLQLDNTRDFTLLGGDLTLDNASGELRILESAGGVFYGIIDITDLNADRTYTFPDASGTVCLTSGNCAGIGGTGDVLNNGQNGPLTVGTNDATSLTLETGNAPRLTISSGGTVTVHGLNNAGVVHTNASGDLSTGDVALGSETTGDYVASFSAGNGLTGDGAGEGSTPTLAIGAGNGIQVNPNDIAVLYGATANTAVQGNILLTCPSGTGNVTGGGTSITLGSGGACANLSTINNPTFSTSVTTPILTNAGQLLISATGAGNDITLDSVDALILTAGGNLTLTGFDCTASANGGVLTTDASGNVICGDDDGAGALPTFQTAYDNDTNGGNVIVSLNSTDGAILFRDNPTPLGGTLFAVQDNTGSTSYLEATAASINVGTTLSLGANILQGSTAVIDFTNFDVQSDGDILTAGDIDVNGGNLNSSGALTVTPGAGTNLNVILSAAGNFAVNSDDLVVQTSTGNVGIGDTTPAALLTVGNGDLFQVTSSGSVSSALSNAQTWTLTPALAAGARSTDVFTISQADDANTSTGNLLQLTNLDTSSTIALLDVSQAASGGVAINLSANVAGANGRGIQFGNVSGTNTTHGINMGTVSSGSIGFHIGIVSGTSSIGFNASSVQGTSSGFSTVVSGGGTGLSVNGSAIGGGVGVSIGGINTSINDFNGDLLRVNPTREHDTATTITDTGNFIDVSRSITTNHAGAIMDIQGDLATLSSTCIQTLGSCSDSSNILELNQQFTSASGAVLNVLGAGTGSLATLDASNTSANGVSIDIQSNSSSQYALRVTSNNGANTGLIVLGNGNVGLGTASPSSFRLQVAGHVGPETNDTYDLGSDSLRWRDLYLGGETIHIGTSTTDEGLISYDTTGNIFNFNTDGTANGDIAFFTDDLFLDKSTGQIGIGTTTPGRTIDVLGNWGGNVVTTATVDSTATSTISTQALAYYVESTATNGDCNIADKTFNITGLSNTEGSFAFIVSKATDNNCTSNQVNVTVQINGATVSTVVANSAINTTVTENYTIAYVNGTLENCWPKFWNRTGCFRVRHRRPSRVDRINRLAAGARRNRHYR